MTAVVIGSDYPDLERGREYEIKRVWNDYHMRLVGTPRLYDMKSFSITHKGKPISYAQAYKRYCIEKHLRGE